MTKTTEIAPNVFRIASWQRGQNTEVCQYLLALEEFAATRIVPARAA